MSIDSRQKDVTPHSMIFIPLLYNDNIVGLMSFAKEPNNSMDDNIINFFESLSKYVSLVVGSLFEKKRRENIAKELIENHDKLSLLNEELENRVKERTEELEAINSSLHREIEARIVSEQDVKKSEANLKSILDSSAGTYVLVDTNFKVQAFNKLASQSAKYLWNKEICFGDYYFDILPSIYEKSNMEDVKIASIKQTTSREVKVLDPNGRSLWLQLGVNSVRTDSGELLGFCFSTFNITDKKRAELINEVLFDISKSINSTSDILELFESIHTAVGNVIIAKNFYISLLNKTKDKINFRYFIDEIDNANFQNDHIEIDLDDPISTTAEVIRSGKSHLLKKEYFLERFKNIDSDNYGSIPFVWLGVPLILKNEVIGAIIVQSYAGDVNYTGEDQEFLELISEQISIAISQKMAVDEIKASEERFSKAFRISPDSININRLSDGMYLEINDGFTKISGYTREEVIGKTSIELNIWANPEDRNQLVNELKTKGECLGLEAQFIMKDGILKFGMMSARIIEINGETCILSITRDMTESKNLQKQILRSQRMESLGTLASGIAHDLNNVLTPIMGSLQILGMRITDEKNKKMLKTLVESTERGSHLVKQILMFARGRKEENISINLRNMINEVIKITSHSFPKSIEVITKINENLFSVIGDPTQLHQIIMNLCVNAKDAMPDGGKLTIIAENILLEESYVLLNPSTKAGSYVIISISDTGTGIPLELQEKIFEPFFTTKELGKGTGLGLSTVYSIIKSHGGFINLYSEPKTGTIFKVYLPALAETATSAQVEEKIGIPEGNGELILVVDDEEAILEISRLSLESFNYKVITAKNGTEAISVYLEQKDKIKAIIIDLVMPVMDGNAAIQVLQSINPSVKIIAVSGYIPSDTVLKDRNVAATLTKPYPAEKLLKTLKHILST